MILAEDVVFEDEVFLRSFEVVADEFWSYSVVGVVVVAAARDGFDSSVQVERDLVHVLSPFYYALLFDTMRNDQKVFLSIYYWNIFF